MKTKQMIMLSLVIVWCVSWAGQIFAAEYDPLVERAQQKLTELGYDPGPADGRMGKKTIAAINSFQQDNALQVTGELNDLTQQKLGISAEATILSNPGNLTGFPNAVPGDTMLFRVTGKTSGGSVWGTDLYTTDSALASVAVHAGILQEGEEGIVKVTFAPGQPEYKGSSRNGVTSSAWESYALSYKVETALLEAGTVTSEPMVLPDPGSLTGFPDAAPGDTMLFRVTGNTSGGSVWGTDLYTTDSTLALAVVHAGVLKAGEEGIVKVTFAPGQPEYKGSSRNGVTSSAWGSYEISYSISRE